MSIRSRYVSMIIIFFTFLLFDSMWFDCCDDFCALSFSHSHSHQEIISKFSFICFKKKFFFFFDWKRQDKGQGEDEILFIEKPNCLIDYSQRYCWRWMNWMNWCCVLNCFNSLFSKLNWFLQLFFFLFDPIKSAHFRKSGLWQ